MTHPAPVPQYWWLAWPQVIADDGHSARMPGRGARDERVWEVQ